MSADQSRPEINLNPADAAAVDALLESGFDLSRVAEAHRERAGVVLRLLDGLGSGPAGQADSFVAGVMARIAGSTGAEAPESRRRGWIEDDSGLSEADIDAFEALVNHGFEPRQVSGAVRERAAHQAALLSLLDTPSLMVPSGQDREALVRRTLGAISAQVDGQADRMRIETGRGARGWRLADLASIAAVLVIGAVVLMPILSTLRQNQSRAMCTSNFAAAGLGFGLYANDHKEAMPMASASLAGTPWWFVGKPEQSNSANLYTLASAGYLHTLDPLTCPSCSCAPRGKCQPGTRDWTAMEQVSYSFQNLFSSTRPKWSSVGRMVVLADRSPITLGSVRKEAMNPFLNSPNHQGKGQNVLFSDGTAEWLTIPMAGPEHDNIWLPREIEVRIDQAEWEARTGQPVMLLGWEQPGAPGNVFLGP